MPLPIPPELSSFVPDLLAKTGLTAGQFADPPDGYAVRLVTLRRRYPGTETWIEVDVPFGPTVVTPRILVEPAA